MSRTSAFRALTRAIQVAEYCEREGLSAHAGLERLAEARAAAPSRREVLQRAAGITAGIATVPWFLQAGPAQAKVTKPSRSRARVAIVGAGLAGLACADSLEAVGLRATLFETRARTGGRCLTARGVFPGQSSDLGGEYHRHPPHHRAGLRSQAEAADGGRRSQAPRHRLPLRGSLGVRGGGGR